MTQKEYQEKINEYENKLKECQEKIKNMEIETYNYKDILEQNAGLNNQLRMEEQRSNVLSEKVKTLEEVIEHYKVMLGSININVNK